MAGGLRIPGVIDGSGWQMTDLSCCPFCDERPSFTDVELKDERRYAEKQLRCCSITMSATLSFGQYKGLTDAQIDHTLRSELVKNWNTRASEPPIAWRCRWTGEPDWKYGEKPCSPKDHAREEPGFEEHGLALSYNQSEGK